MSVLHDVSTLLDRAEWPSFLEAVAFSFFFSPFLREELMKFYGVKGTELQNECGKGSLF